MIANKREFDIILIGATGFTGKRAARYFLDNSPDSYNIGFAARDKEKLDALAYELGIDTSNCFIVNTKDKSETDILASKTRIIVTTVGPYSLYGEQVIASCAEYGTHYLDITGEVGFIKKMADKYGSLARQNRSIFIPFSGFDSVPAEICTFLLSKRFSQEDEVYIRSYYSLKGGLNGGTIATMMNKFETGEYKLMNNPRLAMDTGEQELAEAKDRTFFGYDTSLKRWITPFIMSGINSKVVYRSADLLRQSGKPYFKKIAYSEHLTLGKWYNPIPFLLTFLTLTAIQTLGPSSWFRKLFLKFAPAPGEGPNEESIENGFFKVTAIATSESGKKEKLTCLYQGDPGNKATVFFLFESTFALLELLETEHGLKDRFGFLTPASAFGDILVERLKLNGYFIN